MAFDTQLATRVRDYLDGLPHLETTEKRMFGGLAFLINGKMCVNVSGDKLMCRFDPALQEEVLEKKDVHPMIMKGRKLHGYCYVEPPGFRAEKDFQYFMELCLRFNAKAKASKK